MSGNTIGGRKATQTIKDRFGVTPEGKSKLHVEIGSMGGKSKHPNKGFAADRERARAAGAKGGAISKRKPKSYKVGDKEYLV